MNFTYIASTGALALKTINVGEADIYLRTNAGSIVNDSSSIIARNLALYAGGTNSSVGAPTAVNDINVTLSGTLTAWANEGSGGVYVQESNAMVINGNDVYRFDGLNNIHFGRSIYAGSGGIELESTGTITDNTGGNWYYTDITTNANLTIRNATGLGTAANTLDLNHGTLQVTTLSGDAFLTDWDTIALGAVNVSNAGTDHDLDLRTVNGGGSILNNGSNVIARNLTRMAYGNIGASTAANDINITLSGTLTADARGWGSVYITETGDMSIASVNAWPYSIELEATGAILDANGSNDTATDITGNVLTIRNATRLGNSILDALNLSIEYLSVTNSGGNAYFTEANEIYLQTVNVGANDLTVRALGGSIRDPYNQSKVTAHDLILRVDGGGQIGSTEFDQDGNWFNIDVALSGSLTAVGLGGVYITETSAGGDMSVASINAGSSYVEIQALNGIIKDANGSADTDVDITGGLLRIHDSKGLGNSPEDALNLSGSTLLVDNTTGPAFLTAANGISLSRVNVGAANNLNLRALAGNIAEADYFDYFGNYINQMITANNVVLTVDANGAAIGASGVDNDINVTLTGTVTASAAVGNGGIYLTETGNMSVLSINANTGNIELQADGGTIKDANGTNDEDTDVIAANFTVRNSSGIGSSTLDALNLDITGLAIANGSGDAFLTTAGGFAMGMLNINVAYNLDLRAKSGSITDNNSNVTAGNLTLRVDANNASIGAPGLANHIELHLSGTLNAFAQNGNGGIFFTQSGNGNMALGTIDAGGGNVELEANDRSMLDNGSNIIANNLSLTATGAFKTIGSPGAANDINVTLAGSLTVTAASGFGGIYITETGDMLVNSINAGGGERGGNIELGAIVGSITDVGGVETATDITGNLVTFRNSIRLGNSAADALNLNINYLVISSNSGNVFITTRTDLPSARSISAPTISICRR